MADEEETQTEETTKPPEAQTSVEGETAQELINRANKAADRIKAANKETARLVGIQEALKVEDTLAGKTTAGTRVEQTQDEKDIASAKKLLEGTGYEDLFDKPEANKA